MDLLVHCCMEEDPEVKLLAFQCLMDVGKLLYDLMNDNYINVILKITTQAIACDDPNLVVAATEFWVTIAEEEKERQELSLKHQGVVFGKESKNFIKSNLTV